MQTVQYIDRTPRNYEKLTVTSAAVVRLTAAYRDASKAVYLTTEGGTLRYRIEGGDPDANDGHQVFANQRLYLVDPCAIRNLRMIALAGDVTVIVTYYV